MSLASRDCDAGARSIECDECGHAVVLRSDEDPKTFRRWLTRHGWTTGASDVCADCTEKHRHAADRDRLAQRRAS